MEAIDRDAVLRLLAEEPTQLVDVLGPAEYDEEHLPGAINIPLLKLGRQAREWLDPSRPVVVYCYGIVGAEALTGDGGRPVGDVMQEGPVTFRPNVALSGFGGELRRRGLARALVTRSNGTLIGLVRLEDLPEHDAIGDDRVSPGT